MGSLAQRMLVSADADRRRLERSLHDGAQQRLAALSATLGLALRRLDSDDADGGRELVAEAGEEARRCLEDLRDLARDIYPAVVAERGLAGALSDLARRAPAPVELIAAPETRLPEPVELTAYAVVAQALSALGEDAEASVEAVVSGDDLVVTIAGAAPSGELLERLADRVEALGGSIEAAAGDGRPPRLRAAIPALAGWQ